MQTGGGKLKSDEKLVPCDFLTKERKTASAEAGYES